MMRASHCLKTSFPRFRFKIFELVRLAFKEFATKTNMGAIFKRTAFFVNSPKHFYYWAAGINASKVDRLAMLENGFLAEEGRKIYVGYNKGGYEDLPESLQEEVQKEERGRPCARAISIENTIFQKVH